jgi:hypothetical protein
MNWFGLQYRPFTIEKGDFMDPKYRNLIIHEATVIFINNYAFKSDLETQIKREFLSELKDGTKIISTKPYVPINKNAITDRQMSGKYFLIDKHIAHSFFCKDIAAIIDVVEMKPCANPCSWTSAYVPYYLHTVNRAKVCVFSTEQMIT